MNLFNKISNLVAAGVMVFFSIPKLLGAEDAIKGFEQFRGFVPLEPDIFRIIAGLTEVTIAILLVVYTFKNKENLGKLAYFLLLSTMFSGLVLEFFARPEPEMTLVIIAIILSGLSIYKLKTLLIKQ